MKMAKKERLLKAFSLEIEFFGGWKAIIYGSIPLIYWLIRRFGRGRVGEIVAFCLAYAVAAAVFVWQFFTAERKLAVLDTLDPTEKRQLQPLVLKKESQLVQNVFNTIENKTRLQRDFIGWWRVEQETRICSCIGLKRTKASSGTRTCYSGTHMQWYLQLMPFIRF